MPSDAYVLYGCPPNIGERERGMETAENGTASVRVGLATASVVWTLTAFNFAFGLVCNSLVISTILRDRVVEITKN